MIKQETLHNKQKYIKLINSCRENFELSTNDDWLDEFLTDLNSSFSHFAKPGTGDSVEKVCKDGRVDLSSSRAPYTSCLPIGAKFH